MGSIKKAPWHKRGLDFCAHAAYSEDGDAHDKYPIDSSNIDMATEAADFYLREFLMVADATNLTTGFIRPVNIDDVVQEFLGDVAHENNGRDVETRIGNAIRERSDELFDEFHRRRNTPPQRPTRPQITRFLGGANEPYAKWQDTDYLADRYRQDTDRVDDNLLGIRQRITSIQLERTEWLAQRVAHYIMYAACTELYFHQVIPRYFTPSADLIWVGFDRLAEHQGWPRTAFDMAEIFRDTAWPGGYGGELWAIGTDWLGFWQQGRTHEGMPVDNRLFLDRAFALQHNGGTYFSKVGWKVDNKRGWSIGALTCSCRERPECGCRNVLNAHGTSDWATLLSVASPDTVELFGLWWDTANRIRERSGAETIPVPVAEIEDTPRYDYDYDYYPSPVTCDCPLCKPFNPPQEKPAEPPTGKIIEIFLENLESKPGQGHGVAVGFVNSGETYLAGYLFNQFGALDKYVKTLPADFDYPPAVTLGTKLVVKKPDGFPKHFAQTTTTCSLPAWPVGASQDFYNYQYVLGFHLMKATQQAVALMKDNQLQLDDF